MLWQTIREDAGAKEICVCENCARARGYLLILSLERWRSTISSISGSTSSSSITAGPTSEPYHPHSPTHFAK